MSRHCAPTPRYALFLLQDIARAIGLELAEYVKQARPHGLTTARISASAPAARLRVQP